MGKYDFMQGEILLLSLRRKVIVAEVGHRLRCRRAANRQPPFFRHETLFGERPPPFALLQYLLGKEECVFLLEFSF